MFEVEFSSASAKFIKKSDAILKERLLDKIEKLASEPFPTDCKRVVGRDEKLFRVRVGDYRILYLVDYGQENRVFIADIDKRSRVYD